MVMLHCSIGGWDLSIERRGVVDYRYLTSIPIRKQSILIAYIVKSTKNQKGKPQKKALPFLKNDITNNLRSQKPVIYSSNQRFRKSCDMI
jgi:hypothetical protein